MSCRELVFLHFNDVYHISNGERIARFLTQLEAYRGRHEHSAPYTVFSGDVFSPSPEASMLRGAHMLPLLRELRVDVGCYGNHDFDFGEDRLRELSSETHFPWLLSNVHRLGERNGAGGSARWPTPAAADEGLLPDEGRLPDEGLLPDEGPPDEGLPDEGLLASARRHHVAELQGLRVGFFGLAGTDWPSNCRELPPCSVASPVEAARECSRHLRRVERCDVVVAVTHMRLPEDVGVSEALRDGPVDERVDLVLGGHDHELLRRYGGEVSGAAADARVVDCSFSGETAVPDAAGRLPEARGDVRIVKSGTDWNGLSCVRLRVDGAAAAGAKVRGAVVEQVLDVGRLELDAASLSDSRRRVGESLRGVNALMDGPGAEPRVRAGVELEGTGSAMRSRETNLGNMLADMARAFYDVDAALVNGGSVRCDRRVGAAEPPAEPPAEPLTAPLTAPLTPPLTAPLTARDLMDISPFNNPLVVKRVGGAAMLDALENSFSDAHADGRFLHLSGLTVTADWSRSQGQRVLEAWHVPPGQGRPRRIARDDDGPPLTVAMAAFIADGFDGYAPLAHQETLVGAAGAVTDTQLLLRTFGHGPGQGTVDDERRLERARASVVVGRDGAGLPVVAPRTEGRIVAVDASAGSSPGQVDEAAQGTIAA